MHRAAYKEILPMFREIGMVKIDLSELKKTLLMHPNKCRDMMRETYPPHIKGSAAAHVRWLGVQIRAVSIEPTNVRTYVE